MNRILVFIALIVIFGTADSNAQIEKYLNYRTIEQNIDSLYALGQYREAVELLDQVIKTNSENLYMITSNIIGFSELLEDYEKILDTYEYGLKQGLYYSINNSPEFLNRLSPENRERLSKIVKLNEEYRAKAQEKAKAISEVTLPQGYNVGEKYPLLIVLHGGNGTIKDTKSYWEPNIQQDNLIIAYLQSSEISSYNSYTWWKRNKENRNDIKYLYEKIIDQYSVNQNSVIIAGFSAGATMAIDISINYVIPTIGFIVGSPGKPEEFNRNNLKIAVGRNIRGYIFAGENDYYRPRQIEAMKIFDDVGFEYEFNLIKNHGHDYPENFQKVLEQAFLYVQNRGK